MHGRLLSSAISLVFLAAGMGCGVQNASEVSIDPALAKLVPPDATVLAGIDVKKLKVTPYYSSRSYELNIPLLDSVSREFGFDPRRDISDVLISWNGKNLIVAAKGRFAKDGIEQRLREGGQQTRYKQQLLLGSSGSAITFLNSEVALAGKMHAVKSVIDIQKAGTGQVAEEFASAVLHISKRDQLWLVSRSGLPFADMPVHSDIASILSNFAGYVSWTSARIAVDTGMHFEAQVECVSSAGSKRVDDALRAGLGLARLTTKESATDLLRLYNSMQVRRDKEAVYVHADLPSDLIDQLLARAASFNRINSEF